MSNSTYCEDHYEQPKWIQRIEELEQENKDLKKKLSKYKQMMKDAVDGIVCSQRGDMAIVKSNIFFPTDLKKGDKVRTIVIKEDDV